MTRTEAQTKELFDEWAKSYDADLQDESGPLIGYQQSLNAVNRAFPVTAGMHVLDIGIGTGAIAVRFAEQGAQITGIDISEEMLAVCRAQHPQFQLDVGTFTNIPSNEATFDAVVSGFAFHETPPPQREDACRAMARVLKTGGYLCLLDIMFASAAATAEARQLIASSWDSSEDYAIIGDLDTMLRQHGFTSVKWQQTAPFHWMVVARKG